MLINERKLRSIVRSVIRESFGGPDQKQAALVVLKQAIKAASPKSPKGSNKLYRDRPDMSLSISPMSGPGGCARAKLILKTYTTTSSLGVCLYDNRIDIVYNDENNPRKGERAVYFTQSITPDQIVNGGASKLASDIVRAHAANWYYAGTPYNPENDEFADESWEDEEYSVPPAMVQPEMHDDDDWEDDYDPYDETPRFPGDYNGYLNRKYDEEMMKNSKK